MDTEVVIHQAQNAYGIMLGGQPMTFLVTAKHSKHTSMFEWMIPAHFSTGLHIHEVQEETFYVIEGECEWRVGDQLVSATPGTFVFIPPGTPHNIANVTDKPARMIMTVSPPGHEHYFEELAVLASNHGQIDPQVIGDLRRRYDTVQLSTLRTESSELP
jgi:quercetin dioxygenase-like cupin family protein